MRKLAVAFGIGCSAAILATPASGAAPSTKQITAAAGQPDLRVLDVGKLSLPETDRDSCRSLFSHRHGRRRLNPASSLALLVCTAGLLCVSRKRDQHAR
jgi:hypothetical protein